MKNTSSQHEWIEQHRQQGLKNWFPDYVQDMQNAITTSKHWDDPMWLLLANLQWDLIWDDVDENSNWFKSLTEDEADEIDAYYHQSILKYCYMLFKNEDHTIYQATQAIIDPTRSWDAKIIVNNLLIDIQNTESQDDKKFLKKLISMICEEHGLDLPADIDDDTVSDTSLPPWKSLQTTLTRFLEKNPSDKLNKKLTEFSNNLKLQNTAFTTWQKKWDELMKLRNKYYAWISDSINEQITQSSDDLKEEEKRLAGESSKEAPNPTIQIKQKGNIKRLTWERKEWETKKKLTEATNTLITNHNSSTYDENLYIELKFKIIEALANLQKDNQWTSPLEGKREKWLHDNAKAIVDTHLDQRVHDVSSAATSIQSQIKSKITKTKVIIEWLEKKYSTQISDLEDYNNKLNELDSSENEYAEDDPLLIKQQLKRKYDRDQLRDTIIPNTKKRIATFKNEIQKQNEVLSWYKQLLDAITLHVSSLNKRLADMKGQANKLDLTTKQQLAFWLDIKEKAVNTAKRWGIWIATALFAAFLWYIAISNDRLKTWQDNNQDSKPKQIILNDSLCEELWIKHMNDLKNPKGEFIIWNTYTTKGWITMTLTEWMIEFKTADWSTYIYRPKTINK